jgi:hypothetical protein
MGMAKEKIMSEEMENDFEARLAIWSAICHSADLLTGNCSVYISTEPKSEERVTKASTIPVVKTWQLMEALCLLAVLLKAEKVISKEVCNIFGRSGPLHFVEDGEDRYLWSQVSIPGKESSLGSRPDLIVTNDSKTPTAETIIRIIECKCRKSIGAQVIRAEFGKAYDLKVTSYLVWSFITPNKQAIEGARNLGLNLEALGFDTDMREKLIEDPKVLLYHVANTIESSKRENRLALMLRSAADQVDRKTIST